MLQVSGEVASRREDARIWAKWVAAAAVLVACLRLVSWNGTLSHSFDEPVHIASGLTWLASGVYVYDLHHPPLARIFVALGPWVAGAHPTGETSVWIEASRVMETGAGYDRNLLLARLGTLPFFLLGSLGVWWLALRTRGTLTAMAAVVIFTLLPPVLAHAGLATNDMALTAMLLLAVTAFLRWLDAPRDMRRALLLGVAAALGLCTKFSFVPYFGAFVLLTFASRWIRKHHAPSGTFRGLARPLAVAVAAGFVVTWALYRFSVGPLDGFVVPMPELFGGLLQVASHNQTGHVTYLLGQAGLSGTWRFFPVALGVKTPLVVLGLALVGMVWLARDWRRTDRGDAWLLLVVAVAGVAMAANLNQGVRHILPVYATVAIAAGALLEWLWRRGAASRVSGMVAIAMIAWPTVVAGPDQLAYFNLLAGAEPGRVLVDSDLDWGQDVARLSDEVRRRKIDRLSLSYYGSGDHVWRAVPQAVPMGPADRPRGWVAISESNYWRGAVSVRNGAFVIEPDAYRWLRAYTPAAYIGKSLRLYWVPAGE